MRRHKDHTDAADQAFDRLLQTALREYLEKQKAMERELASFAHWHFDLDKSTLSLGGRNSSQTFAITPIATYLPAAGNWLWAWANDQIPEAARLKSARPKALKDRTQYGIFTTPSFDVTSEEIDELCALALKELAGQAVFKAKDNEPWLFLVID